MPDTIVRAISADGLVKASAISGAGLVEHARQIHHLLPVATAALGRTLLAASMLGNQLKEERGSVTILIKGGGPLGTVTAVSDHLGNVRGCVTHPAVAFTERSPGKLDVGAAVGTSGTLTVMKDIGLKEPYGGTVQLVSGEIAEDLAAYFVESEQIPTACALGVLLNTDQSVLSAGGYLIQLLPGAGEECISRIEKGVAALGPVSRALQDTAGPRELLARVLPGFPLEFLEEQSVEYRCYCSRDRVSAALISMGRKEMEDLIAREGEAEISCQFCGRTYHFDRPELEQLLSGM